MCVKASAREIIDATKNTSIISNCDAKISIKTQKKRGLTVFSDFLTLKNSAFSRLSTIILRYGTPVDVGLSEGIQAPPQRMGVRVDLQSARIEYKHFQCAFSD
jgi:hypothetical protein